MLAVSLPMTAAAADGHFYVSGGIGAGHAPNGTLEGSRGEIDYDLGRPIGGVAAGFDAGSRWRFELDASYRVNDAEVLFFDDARADVAPDPDSRIRALGAALSAIRTFDGPAGLRPYVGVGAGAARVNYRFSPDGGAAAPVDDRDTAFAYQVIAGLDLGITRRLELAADYRYWRVPDFQVSSDAGDTLESSHEVHSAMLHLRYRLGERPLAGLEPAVEDRRWYVSAAAGSSFAKDAEIKNNVANFDAFDVGSVISVAAGYDLRGPWRFELEASRRRNEAELVDFNPDVGEFRASGDVRSVSLLANVAYEGRRRSGFRPYAALGVGAARSSWDVSLDGDGSLYVDDSDTAGAFQVVFGAAAPLGRSLETVVEYRYWMTGLFDLEEPDGRPMRTELTVHSVMFGLRYTPR